MGPSDTGCWHPNYSAKSSPPDHFFFEKSIPHTDTQVHMQAVGIACLWLRTSYRRDGFWMAKLPSYLGISTWQAEMTA